jgi:DNA-binding response OmpR family regulator
MARALGRAREDLYPILNGARERGEIVAIPAADWPPGTRRDERRPTVAPLRTADADSLVLPLMRRFRLTTLEARLLATLLIRAEVTKTSLHLAMSEREEPDSDIKLVDVKVCHLRRKMATARLDAPFAIETIWGRGYALPRKARDAVLRALGSQEAGT